MKTEKSCGAVVFTREHGHIRYVIVMSKEGINGFPKGHAEQSETEAETALREVREETGLSVTLLDGFRREDIYVFIRQGETITKHIVYFLGEYANQQPIAQESELNGIHLMDYPTAMTSFQFESSKRILTQAHSYLSQFHDHSLN